MAFFLFSLWSYIWFFLLCSHVLKVLLFLLGRYFNFGPFILTAHSELGHTILWISYLLPTVRSFSEYSLHSRWSSPAGVHFLRTLKWLNCSPTQQCLLGFIPQVRVQWWKVIFTGFQLLTPVCLALVIQGTAEEMSMREACYLAVSLASNYYTLKRYIQSRIWPSVW